MHLANALATSPTEPDSKIVRGLERFIFFSRWILAPLYAGLAMGMAAYSFKFLVELFHLCWHFWELSEAEMMIGLLSLVDVTMVGNLVIMIMIGSYSAFVREIDFSKLPHRPQGFAKLSAGMLKVKMGMSLIGVSSIHLLKIFTEVVSDIGHHPEAHFNWPPIVAAMSIHMLFVVSTIAMGYVDNSMHLTQHQTESSH